MRIAVTEQDLDLWGHNPALAAEVLIAKHVDPDTMVTCGLECVMASYDNGSYTSWPTPPELFRAIENWKIGLTVLPFEFTLAD